MTPRLLASWIWLVIVLTPPLRYLVSATARFLWPSIEPFGSAYRLGPTWTPLVGGVVVGYLATWGLLTIAFRRRRFGRESLGGRDRVGRFGFLATLAWGALGAVILGPSIPLLLAGALVLAGLTGQRRPRPVPLPEPAPLPDPIPIPDPQPTPPPEDLDFEEDSEDDEYYYRAFSWLFNEEPFRKSGRTHRFGFKMRIPKRIYDDYKSRPHGVSCAADYVRFANEELDDEVVNPLASHLRELVTQFGFDALTEIHLAMAFTLCIAYAYDSEYYGGEYPKYPVETLADKMGDCEDHAILCGVLLYRLGHYVALALTNDHAFLGVRAPFDLPGWNYTPRELGVRVHVCEVTPGTSTTTDTTDVQFWLGHEPHGGAKPASFFLVGA